MSGSSYLLAGFRMLRERDILPFFLLPLTINALIFAGAITWSVKEFSQWSERALEMVPQWLDFLVWIVWPIFLLFLLLVVFYAFALLANFIAAPFNGLLAERVAARVRPARGPQITGMVSFLASVPGSLMRELRKLFYFALLALGALLLTLIPVLTPFAPALWLLLGAWTLALEYCDYQADNDGVNFTDLKARLRSRKGLSLTFGAATVLATMIPLINLAVMPAAVCGGTLMWIEQLDA